jgi:hypothetical protein
MRVAKERRRVGTRKYAKFLKYLMYLPDALAMR